VNFPARTQQFESRNSGIGTNLKVRVHVRSRKFFSCPSTFLALQVQLVVLVSWWSVQFGIFLFAVLLLTVPPCPSVCKSGGTNPLPYGVGATGR